MDTSPRDRVAPVVDAHSRGVNRSANVRRRARAHAESPRHLTI